MPQDDKKGRSGTEITKDLTIPKLFRESAARYGKERVAMREKEFGGMTTRRMSNTLLWVSSASA
jgi:hypothetical protein